ncbi:DUF1223 domain-containing protein [Pedobacter sp. HMF7647]|uniref:DUF1223 domain-containing protein n=1 Tax=Hufsiella arboris TaxID=2695275 RepID=A0A7K1Y7T5_9SPHI|nr:DUF1223 domain-containing protein [Hufsiella arboris]MXV50626.1 DUF1223 domain-containing protein [Hufsiella arboris]
MNTSVVFLLLILCGFVQSDNSAKSFALVELFTSEGCSSCPKAEQLLKKLETQYAGKQVFVMELHVDYWDKYGWKDPYSKHEFTERQNEYCKFLKSQVYTPQAVVNGKEPFLGSDSIKVDRSINWFLNQPTLANTPEYSVSTTGNQIKITCTADKELKGNRLIAAVVENGGTNNVTAGENSGKTLNHINIVHELVSTKIGGSQTELVVNLSEKEKSGYNLIVFTQHPRNYGITSVKELKLN